MRTFFPSQGPVEMAKYSGKLALTFDYDTKFELDVLPVLQLIVYATRVQIMLSTHNQSSRYSQKIAKAVTGIDVSFCTSPVQYFEQQRKHNTNDCDEPREEDPRAFWYDQAMTKVLASLNTVTYDGWDDGWDLPSIEISVIEMHIKKEFANEWMIKPEHTKQVADGYREFRKSLGFGDMQATDVDISLKAKIVYRGLDTLAGSVSDW